MLRKILPGCQARARRCAVLAAVWLAWGTAQAAGQSSSLFQPPDARTSLGLSQASWIYQAPLEKKEVRLNDLITVIVDEKTQVISEGEVDQRKKSERNWTLKDWTLIRNWTLIPDPQSAGEPAIANEVDNKYRANGELETRESMKLRIACRVVDLRPNGQLVLEGRRTIMVNEETWDISLGGTIRPDDVLPNNTVLSENVAELRVVKRESGHVRDGYRRGWLQRMLDTYQPF